MDRLGGDIKSTHTQLTVVYLRRDSGSMAETAVPTPPAAAAALGDGWARTAGTGHGSASHPLAEFAQIRTGARWQLQLLRPRCTAAVDSTAVSKLPGDAATLLRRSVDGTAVVHLAGAASRRRSRVRSAAPEARQQERAR